MALKSTLHKFNQWWLAYEYKHTTVAILTLLLFVFLIDSALLVSLFRVLDSAGYASGLVTGFLSVSFFTAAPALVLVVELAQHLNPFLLALLVAIGSVVGDWLILKFFEERIFAELKPIFTKWRLPQLKNRLNKPSTRWILVVAGALFVGSPLPDEIGLALMGISHQNRFVILSICFVLNFVGALMVIMAANALF